MELLILLAIILLFFGAKRIPQLGRSLGSGLREFRKVTAEADEDQGEVREGNKGEERLGQDGGRDGTNHGEIPRTEQDNTSTTGQKP